jgi:hypothetical protein
MPDEPVNTTHEPATDPRGGMRRDDSRTVIAVILIAIGIVALLGTVGWLPAVGGLMGALLFGALGVLLLWLARRHVNDWLMFAAFPAFGLAFASAVPGDVGGAGFLAGTGAGFLALVVAEARRWWAVIPAGVLFTLAVLAWASPGEPAGGAIFFLGLAATFAVVWRGTARPQSWAVFPAAGALALALIVGLTRADWLVPVALIAIGAWLLLRSQLRQRDG